MIGLNALGQMQLRTGQLEAAQASFNRVFELRGDQPKAPLWPASAGPALGLAVVYRQRGDAERLASWLARLGALRDAMRTDTPNASDASLLAARIASLRGDRTLMLDELRTAVRQGYRHHWSLQSDTAFMHWRDDQQFKELVARLKKQNIALRAELVATKAGQALVAAR
jgi:hypothetical protein